MLMEPIDVATATPSAPAQRIRQSLRIVREQPRAWAALEELIKALDGHDPYTAAHSRRVAGTATLLARLMGMDGASVEMVRQASLVHDLGKLTVPVHVLNKMGAPTDGELELLRAHSERGARMLEQTHGLERLAPIVYHHHEHWDGTGYPASLSGSNIPLESRIIFVADAFDAMTSSRPYQPVMSSAAALDEIERCAGRQFDPRVACVIQLAAEGSLLRMPEVDARPKAVAHHTA
jgi:putative nucleotidyltransferase with HDIG domain